MDTPPLPAPSILLSFILWGLADRSTVIHTQHTTCGYIIRTKRLTRQMILISESGMARDERPGMHAGPSELLSSL
jgi:hypothetical protein